jgi:hypothetical protein
MSPTRRRRWPLRLHWAVALMPPPSLQVETGWRTRHRRCPPRLPRSFFLHDFAPPPAIVRPWPRQRRRCGMPAVIRFEVFIVIVVVIVVVVILGLDILCCGHHHLSRCAVASLVAPSPLSPRRRHYCHANDCLIAPLLHQRLVVASSPLSPRQCLCCAATSLVAPHLRRLVVASPTILKCCRLSCHAGWLLPCYLSLCAAVSLFATSLIAPPSL